jgi:hypothetical protein
MVPSECADARPSERVNRSSDCFANHPRNVHTNRRLLGGESSGSHGRSAFRFHSCRLRLRVWNRIDAPSSVSTLEKSFANVRPVSENQLCH